MRIATLIRRGAACCAALLLATVAIRAPAGEPDGSPVSEYAEPALSRKEVDEVLTYAAHAGIRVKRSVAERFPLRVRAIVDVGPMCFRPAELEGILAGLPAKSQKERTTLYYRLDRTRRRLFELELRYREMLGELDDTPGREP